MLLLLNALRLYFNQLHVTLIHIVYMLEFVPFMLERGHVKRVVVVMITSASNMAQLAHIAS